MNNNPVYQRLRELAWRRRLTEAELAEWRAAHPQAAAEADAEAALSDALAALPNAPVPSNFTARVLQRLEGDARRPSPRKRDWFWVWRVLVPRAAVASLVVGASLFAYHRHQTAQRIAVGVSIRTVAGVRSLPSPQILEDFDVIQRLDTTPPADRELLAWLQ
jgi:hypothetical protein